MDVDNSRTVIGLRGSRRGGGSRGESRGSSRGSERLDLEENSRWDEARESIKVNRSMYAVSAEQQQQT